MPFLESRTEALPSVVDHDRRPGLFVDDLVLDVGERLAGRIADDDAHVNREYAPKGAISLLSVGARWFQVVDE
jgi:hypothetical protein